MDYYTETIPIPSTQHIETRGFVKALDPFHTYIVFQYIHISTQLASQETPCDTCPIPTFIRFHLGCGTKKEILLCVNTRTAFTMKQANALIADANTQRNVVKQIHVYLPSTSTTMLLELHPAPSVYTGSTSRLHTATSSNLQSNIHWITTFGRSEQVPLFFLHHRRQPRSFLDYSLRFMPDRK